MRKRKGRTADSPSVCHLISTFNPVIGGAQRATESLCASLVERGCDAVILTRRVRGTPYREELAGVPIWRAGFPWSGKLGALSYMVHGLWLLLSRLRRFRLLHAQSIDAPLLLAIIAGQLTRRAVVFTMHGEWIVKRTGNRLGRHRLSLIRRHVAAFTTLTEHLASQAREIGVNRVVEVPNGIDPDYLHPPSEREKAAARVTVGLDGDRNVVLFVGRLVELKGLHNLLEAWSQFERSSAHALVLVGGGPEEVRLRRLARDLGLADVLFVGAVADVLPYYWSADVFVLPSHEEGMPVALLEAFSCGLPCVVSDLPTIRSVIDHGRSGLLFPARDSSALREALSVLLAAEGERARLGASARRTVEQRYSLAAVTDQHVRLYASLDSGWAEA